MILTVAWMAVVFLNPALADGTRAPTGGTSAPSFHVQSLDPHFDASKMAGPGVQIDSYNSSGSAKRRPAKVLPAPQEMDRIFSDAKMNAEVSSMDQLDKDLLFRRATKEKLPELSRRYPQIPKAKLKKFSSLVQKACQPTQAGDHK